MTGDTGRESGGVTILNQEDAENSPNIGRTFQVEAWQEKGGQKCP
jgi:hypothetical protein